jgi:hypothetical protein
MKAVVDAREHHDSTCEYRQPGTRAHMLSADIDALQWEEGDIIARLTLLADDQQPTGTVRVSCDAEADRDADEDAETRDERYDEHGRERERELVLVPVRRRQQQQQVPVRSMPLPYHNDIY